MNNFGKLSFSIAFLFSCIVLILGGLYSLRYVSKGQLYNPKLIIAYCMQESKNVAVDKNHALCEKSSPECLKDYQGQYNQVDFISANEQCLKLHLRK